MVKVYEQLNENPLGNYLGEFNVDIDKDTKVLILGHLSYVVNCISVDGKVVIVDNTVVNMYNEATNEMSCVECPVCECKAFDYSCFYGKGDLVSCVCSFCGTKLDVHINVSYKTLVKEKPKVQILE